MEAPNGDLLSNSAGTERGIRQSSEQGQFHELESRDQGPLEEAEQPMAHLPTKVDPCLWASPPAVLLPFHSPWFCPQLLFFLLPGVLGQRCKSPVKAPEFSQAGSSPREDLHPHLSALDL